MSNEKMRAAFLRAWEMGWDAHEAYVNAARGSNRRSVALGDAGDVEGAQNGTDDADLGDVLLNIFDRLDDLEARPVPAADAGEGE